jgi:uncharacterized protein YceK
MRYKKNNIGILMLLFLTSLLISGCGKVKTGNVPVAKEVVNEKGIIPIESVEDKPTAATQLDLRRPDDVKISPAAPHGSEIPPVPMTAPTAPVAPLDLQTGIPPETAELLIADFEGWPNSLGGEISVYGSLEPDWEKVNEQPVSWVYDTISLNYSPANVHSGKNSFRLVNGIGAKPGYTWGSFSMDVGPVTDIASVPKKVKSLDASGYKYLTFWVKGAKGGEKMELLVKDAHALDYSPQIKYKLPDATTEWKKIAVPLSELSGKVDLTQLDNIGIAFGKDVGNMTGDIIYIDDFAFTPLENPMP